MPLTNPVSLAKGDWIVYSIIKIKAHNPDEITLSAVEGEEQANARYSTVNYT